MNITKEQVSELLDFVEAYAGVSPEHKCATILRGLEDAEPVAWLSVDKIGERYLCFSKPNDSDPVTPLYTSPKAAQKNKA